jgi:hypothetical protein
VGRIRYRMKNPPIAGYVSETIFGHCAYLGRCQRGGEKVEGLPVFLMRWSQDEFDSQSSGAFGSE